MGYPAPIEDEQLQYKVAIPAKDATETIDVTLIHAQA
jgi:hypothetical protein